MAIPNFQELMLPLLRRLADGKPARMRDLTASLAEHFALRPDEIEMRHESSGQKVFAGRVGWARTYLAGAGLLESPERGWVRLTDRGRELLKAPPPRLDVAYLSDHYPEFQEFLGRSRGLPAGGPSGAESSANEQTPLEQLEAASQALSAALIDALLERLRAVSPAVFERIVLQVLLALGYGGGEAQAARALGRTGDEGVDGVIDEDPLGLDRIYVQAKRWQYPVGRREVQQFAGALQGQKARKGVFITTSEFTAEARRYIEGLETTRIVLIDGRTLAKRMIEHGVGVSTERRIEIRRIDEDFFAEED